jgi:hypothetical protein
MSQCTVPTKDGPCPGVRLSVYDEGEEEAKRHKWIESEKAGRDLGEWAIRCWVKEHWNGFLRARWLEHLQGTTFWIELDRDDFGLLKVEYQGSMLVEEIVDRLKSGQENLHILVWAIDKGIPTDEVVKILEVLNINSRRLEFLLDWRLSQAQSG